MEIIDNMLCNVEFKDLGMGATFKHETHYYMKVMLVLDQMENYNAVHLTDGGLCCFNDDELVIPFNCELIVL